MTIRAQEAHVCVRLAVLLGAAALVLSVALALGRPAEARRALIPAEPATVSGLRSLNDHYRALTWTYELAARSGRTRTSYSYRHATSRSYLRWSAALWARRAEHARRLALARIERRLTVDLPRPASTSGALLDRVARERTLAVRLRRIYPGRVSRRWLHVRSHDARVLLQTWESRDAVAALAVSRYARRALPPGLVEDFACIHGYEASWTANTGNGYYGGLQMDAAFQHRYGAEFVRRWGTADNWPVWAQLQAAVRAYRSGRGFAPWPNTARICGLI